MGLFGEALARAELDHPDAVEPALRRNLVAGLQALATARKLGAVVQVFDVRSAVKEEVLSLGGKFVEVEGATDDSSAGGYAVEQSEEYKQKQAAMIQDHARQADEVVTTAQIPGRKAPVLIQNDTVEAMKAGSISSGVRPASFNAF